MARPRTLRQVQNYLTDKLLPGQAAEEPIAFWHDPTGENHIASLADLGPNDSPFVNNIVLSPDAMYITRPGTESVGSAASSAICGLTVFSSRTSTDYYVRVTTTGVDVWAGSSWAALTGPTLSLAEDIFVEFTVWDDFLLFTDATSGIYAINFTDYTYSLIATAPIVKHVTTFGGRIITSYVLKDADPGLPGTFPTRIEWSVKNNNADWLGMGSGYEDLLSSPGGVVDVQHGVIPLTDVEAIAVRSSSIWIMNTTGYFDTPFQFTYRFDIGTDSPYTIVRTPRPRKEPSATLAAQVMLLTTDDVVVVRPESVTPVGFPIRDQLLGTTLDARRALAGYEPRNREYWIHVPPLDNLNTTSVVWRYRIDENVWTHCTYPFKMSRMAFRDVLFQQTIDQLTGTMDSLVGSYDSLGLSARQYGAVFAGSTAGTYSVIRERAGVVGDVDALGSAQGISIEVQTGLVLPSSPRDNLSLLMLELLYEATQPITMIFETTYDGGHTWESYGTLNLAVTSGPTIVAFRKTIHRRKLQVRMRSSDGSTLQLHTFFIKVVKGSAINQ